MTQDEIDKNVKYYQDKLNDFLAEHPKMGEFQQKIEDMLDGIEDQHDRSVALQKLMLSSSVNLARGMLTMGQLFEGLTGKIKA